MRHRLRDRRIEKGVTQTFISSRLGYKSPSGYANIEMGRNEPSLENALIIANILDSDVKELFFDEKLHNTSN
ncbi:putative transcriptional regulator [Salibacterium salarium]|uniref:helix-turn-helix transcriptional regulator n=1 Tax=Salibacterium salarium TaxID=284579 RepID=UPI002780F94D|nr:helix-turn-helix transcriptional regulator [Salibacterium salarium]MDQ0299686.1 putative transcriptional regulator [Salibacterium salarium]